MKYRKLRIAWSVVWGVIAVLLCVLWVRSYYWFDVARIDPIYKAYSIGGQSGAGCLVLDYVNSFTPAFPQTTFRYQCTSMDELRAALPQSDLPSSAEGRFQATLTRDFISFVVPHWFLMLAAASSAAVPWLPWWSSRFSLRTLLIATTLVAVALGVMVWIAR